MIHATLETTVQVIPLHRHCQKSCKEHPILLPALRREESLRKNSTPRRRRHAVSRRAEGEVLRVERLEERHHDPELVVQLLVGPVDHGAAWPLATQAVKACGLLLLLHSQ